MGGDRLRELGDDERVEWTQDFMLQLRDIRRFLTERHPRVAEAAAVAFSMIPSQYRDAELRKAYRELYVEKPKMDDPETFERFRELLTGFMDWCDRHHILPWQELGDDTERTWRRLRMLARRGKLDEIRVLLGVDDAA